MIKYNVQKSVSVEIVDVTPADWYKVEENKGWFWWMGIYIENEGYRHKLFNCHVTSDELKEYGGIFIDESGDVYNKPYIDINFVDGSTHTVRFDTHDEQQAYLDGLTDLLKKENIKLYELSTMEEKL